MFLLAQTYHWKSPFQNRRIAKSNATRKRLLRILPLDRLIWEERDGMTICPLQGESQLCKAQPIPYLKNVRVLAAILEDSRYRKLI